MLIHSSRIGYKILTHCNKCGHNYADWDAKNCCGIPLVIISENNNSISRSLSHQVMPDIQPYQSMVDGSMITSRSKHRDHLKQHGCIEVGNETKYLKKHGEYKPEGQRQHIIESMRKKGFL